MLNYRLNLLIFICVFGFLSLAFAQAPVLLEVPNVLDASAGWQIHERGTSTRFVPKTVDGNRAYGAMLVFKYKFYINLKNQMTVYVFSWVNNRGIEEEFCMLYGVGETARFAINMGDRWYPSATPYNQNPEGVRVDNVVVKRGLPVSVRLSLNTVNGPMRRILKLD